MCLCFWELGTSGEASQPLLIVAFNRDEYFDRPTAELHCWDDGSGVIAGRDLEGQGTWLGISAARQRVAWLTNLRSADPIEPSSLTRQHASRGELPTRFLTGTQSPLEFVQSLDPAHYHGYNLVVGDLRARRFAYSNNGGAHLGGQAPPAAASGGPGGEGGGGSCTRGEGGGGGAGGAGGGGGRGPDVRELAAGVVYGLSNGTLMEWPKVTTGVRVLQELLPSITPGRPVPWDRLFQELLGDSRRLVPPTGAAEGGSGQPPDARAPVTSAVCGAGRPPGSDAAEAERRLAEEAAGPGSGEATPGSAGSAGGVVTAGGQADGGAARDGNSCCTGAEDAGRTGGFGGGAGITGRSGDAGTDGDATSGVGAAGSADGVDAAYFLAQLEHITSGRFVQEVQSPYGMYGTRSQTAIVVWHDGTGEARERSRCADGRWKETALQFQMEGWQVEG
ncbi:hypothetical protein TSOC_002251 [Tetrabaena socialis]|uniref:Transport and Golgi organization 2 n=1 Tax=Tetrabaena socialis TaxID=47790 RepID=A0A2J8AEJ2_9CHLO|nr:hypothetical protein TSOC_002251 [Tetrabaena socialis]|eukprot:PNH10933.1 hypothetical protein TSOC_002251 [Tetrabaena socialis]